MLSDSGFADNTVILFCSDHGDMLGERGLWFKMSFFEGAARTPLLLCIPGYDGRTIDQPVSNLDIVPTIAELAGLDVSALAQWLDGESLLPLLSATARRALVAMEYAAEGSEAPSVALVDGHYKYIRCALDPDMMFDLAADPHERVNIADQPAFRTQAQAMRADIDARWSLADFDQSVRCSQARRLLVYDALRNGSYFPWDYQPLQKASERYMRNHMDLNILEDSQRWPPPR